MSSQKPRISKQKSLLSWVKPQDNKAKIKNEKVEKCCVAEMPETRPESGQNYAVVESIEAVGSMLPLLGERRNQPIRQ